MDITEADVDTACGIYSLHSLRDWNTSPQDRMRAVLEAVVPLILSRVQNDRDTMPGDHGTGTGVQGDVEQVIGVVGD